MTHHAGSVFIGVAAGGRMACRVPTYHTATCHLPLPCRGGPSLHFKDG
jgi:hypothetical protein